MRVRLFSTPICPYCQTLKKFLVEQGVQFEEINVLENKTAEEEMIKATNQMTVPVLEIDGEYIVGFDRKKIVEKLGLSCKN
ncbi:MAG TPA: glutaredoxin domain-containing protein [Candidatus Pacearchaeota archaeon]|nr:glutaredoxin domain-containing protein [Candidatus Pacearchaeota archaeon]HQG09338.1 glutaredoxin domain-containing protein [Candidatus Pacearchaeota archaeon]HQH20256.1 glutaredoxin domain-containing protein [Candidatus Pacearchaeota archaeon]HRR94856.1 glutaredoxin domain-containing protein [Candidatus Paceibacterota bacterium]HRU20943.1 glutaredoxin domain-containing protein [Candidatus Paceibacterota bacterium]